MFHLGKLCDYRIKKGNIGGRVVWLEWRIMGNYTHTKQNKRQCGARIGVIMNLLWKRNCCLSGPWYIVHSDSLEIIDVYINIKKF